ncbi:MAG: hypothetical protein SOZ02_10135 [Hallerella porci]|nr:MULTISPECIES: hypothetical protein [Hallerella]MCI5601462.1 hypothetical protein [Hallerella sp.]MDY3922501.1 hypothetical protein [Hallerella porci]
MSTVCVYAEYFSTTNINDACTFHKSGYKFHTWYDMIWMEKLIGEHREAKPVKFGE